MSQDLPKPKVVRPDARHPDTGEADTRNRSDAGDAENPEPAHRTAQLGRRIRQSDSEVSYTVGYGRPPKHSQFKPKQSGNPKGRSPQKRNFKTMVKEVVEKPVQLRVGGKVRRMTKIQALVETIINRALTDPRAMTSLFVILKQIGYGTEAMEVSPELPAAVDHEAILNEYLGRLGREEPTGEHRSAEDFPDPDEPPKRRKP